MPPDSCLGSEQLAEIPLIEKAPLPRRKVAQRQPADARTDDQDRDRKRHDFSVADVAQAKRPHGPVDTESAGCLCCGLGQPPDLH